MSDFVCKVDEQYLSACENLPEYQDTGYCVLHYPGEEKNKEHFKQALDEKFKDGNCNFAAVYFPEGQSFESRIFGSKADFSNATFRGDVNFRRAFFKEEANFDKATFHGEANFHKASFKGNACFRDATFKGAATFWEAKFIRDACFNKAKFLDRAQFSARRRYRAFNLERAVNFDYVEIEKPELCAFNSLRLRPSWFIYVENLQELKFHEVQWYGLREGPTPREQDEAKVFREELDALRNREGEGKGCQHPVTKNIRQPYQLLARTYRRLSRNYEDNREYPLANEFHYWSMDALRKRSWRRLKGLTPNSLTKKETWHDIREHFGLITTLYWALSGYGVRAARAFWMLVAIWAAFTISYGLVDPAEFKDFGQGIGYRWQAAVYSLLALVRLNPEPSPEEPGLFQFLVGLEGILGPVQIALLALAIRRKVMR